MAEVWWRNAAEYVKECLELHENMIAFDYGYLIKRQIDPSQFMDTWYGAQDYRCLVIGTQGTSELVPGRTLDNPVAVYPTWAYGEDFNDLEDLVAQNIGLDEEACNAKSIPHNLRPRLGQEHRVIITDIPSANLGPVRRVLKLIKELQEDYYECLIHVHGLYGFRTMFGGGYNAVDYEPRELARVGKVVLPSGKEMTYEQAARNMQWVNLVGSRPGELQVPRNRCMFNMKAAKWAAEHWNENLRFRTQGSVDPKPTSPNFTPATAIATRTSSLPVLSGDKFLCDTCSLSSTCKYFRVGEVCSIPGSEPTALTRLFKTRNADDIIDGLGQVLAVQGRRLEKGVENEEEYDELDPEVTKIVNSIMTHGNKLARLLNPALNTPQVGVFVGQGGQASVGMNPKQVTAAIVRELEAQGVPRNKITPEMILKIAGSGSNADAIEVETQAAS